VEETEPKEPELTAFQIAFKEAQVRAGDKKSNVKSKKSKSVIKEEQEEIFNRTLEHRITPG